MKEIIAIAILTFAPLFAQSTDVYFANGILTKPETAHSNANLLKRLINHPNVPKVYIAYNHTFDSHFVKGGPDLFESLLQKLSIIKQLDEWLSNDERVTVHQFDLDNQLSAFKNSINMGNKVLVVAHSQGNLFINEVYESLKEENMEENFDAVSIASPMFSAIKEDTVTFSWDNDLVADLALNPLRKRYYCDARKVEWLKNTYYPKIYMPTDNYIYAEDLEKIYKKEWIPNEPVVNTFDPNVHAFTFYMGEALKDGETDEKYREVFQNRELVSNTLKKKILNKIYEILNNNTNTPDPDTGGGTDTNTTTNPDTNTTTTPTEFDYKNACNNIAFPDPIPTELETSINDIITTAGESIAAPIVCPLIDAAVTAYNLTNVGGLPSIP